jgi:hypothetical protein
MVQLRIFVLSGWFGRLFSVGMAQLADRLRPYGKTTYHAWNDVGVIPTINELAPDEWAVAVVGFSLGANQLGWISNFVNRQMQLGIAYDPSKQSPLVRHVGDKFVQTARRFDRLLCYYHPDAWVYGGSTYAGPNVETIVVNGPHLLMMFNESLHRRTVAEIAILAHTLK